jgi:RNA exonuclease 1
VYIDNFRTFQVKLHKLVKPEKAIVDYKTDITGVSSEDLKTVTCSLADIQVILWFILWCSCVMLSNA